MSGELDRQRARIAQLENEVGPLGAHDTADMAYYQRRAMQLRAEKNQILAAEKERLKHDYEIKLQQMERRMLHDRLQRELAFRERNDLATSTKHNNYSGLLNPPRLGGDTAPKTEAFLKAKHDFKCVSEDAVPGYVVTRVLGAVSGSAYVAGTPEPELENLDLSRSDRSNAVNHMMEVAISRGANAVIGLRFDTSAPVGTAHIEVLAYGTAVNIRRDNGKGQSWDNGHKHVSFKDESLADMLKRALSEDDGGGKKKNKQPNPVAEDEVSFSQIQAMIALLATKGSTGNGAGGSSSQGWGSGGGSSSQGWGGGDSGGWGSAVGGGTTTAWDASGSGGGWGSGPASSGDTGWGSAANTGSNDWNSQNRNDQSWGTQGSRGNDNWGGAGQDSGGGWGQGGDSGGGYSDNDNNGDGYGGWDSRNRQESRRDREPYSPALDPRELAFIISDLVQRSKRPSERSSSRREPSRNRSQPSPMFGWELV